MNQPWSSLPNAHHIDWVIESTKHNPVLWHAAREASWDIYWGGTRDAAWRAAWRAARRAARDAAWAAARDAACGAVGLAACGAAYNLAWDAILALVAYDDCDQYLKMSYEELRIWAALSEHPAAVLLQPMIYIREKLHEPALV